MRSHFVSFACFCLPLDGDCYMETRTLLLGILNHQAMSRPLCKNLSLQSRLQVEQAKTQTLLVLATCRRSILPRSPLDVQFCFFSRPCISVYPLTTFHDQGSTEIVPLSKNNRLPPPPISAPRARSLE